MKKRKYIIIATSFVIAWILTATMGTSQLTKWQDERFLQKQKEEYVSRGKMIFSRRVDADIWNSPEPRPNRFYYYKNTSPFPFIINSEFGQNTGWAIHGNSTLWVWFLGAKFPIFTHRRMHGHSYKQVSTNTNTVSNLSSTKTEPSDKADPTTSRLPPSNNYGGTRRRTGE